MITEKEEWRVVAETDGLYEVSNLGRVRRDGRILKPSTPRNNREYPSVNLRCHGDRRKGSVHRMVAIAFLPPPPFSGAMVRHLDGNNCNNVASNLAWGSGRDNAFDRELHGRTARAEWHGKAKLSTADRAWITACGLPTKQLAERFGVVRTTIQRARSLGQ